MTQFWIFKDRTEPDNPVVRFVAVDPGGLLGDMPKATVTVASGVHGTVVVKQLAALIKEMEGPQGDEAYLEINIATAS